jgi:hypothetical protein
MDSTLLFFETHFSDLSSIEKASLLLDDLAEEKQQLETEVVLGKEPLSPISVVVSVQHLKREL